MDRKDYEHLLSDRRRFAEELRQLADASGELLAPLRSLTEQQTAAVAILGYLWQIIALAKRPQFAIDEGILRQFQKEFIAICPPWEPDAISKDPCFDATIAYLSALMECEEDGRTEAECPDSWGPMGATIVCAMGRIQELKTKIGDLLPDWDSPWPDPPPPIS